MEDIEALLVEMGKPDPPDLVIRGDFYLRREEILAELVLWLDFRSLCQLMEAFSRDKRLRLTLDRVLERPSSWEGKRVDWACREMIYPYRRKVRGIFLGNVCRYSTQCFEREISSFISVRDVTILGNRFIGCILHLKELPRLRSVSLTSCPRLDWTSLCLLVTHCKSLIELNLDRVKFDTSDWLELERRWQRK